MNKDYKELVKFLGERFEKVDERFDGVDKRFGVVGERLDKIDKNLNELKENKADKSDVNNLINSVDAYAKKADMYFQEMLILAHRMDRMEKWIQTIADKVGVKLEF